jgi:hypothetical protein
MIHDSFSIFRIPVNQLLSLFMHLCPGMVVALIACVSIALSGPSVCQRFCILLLPRSLGVLHQRSLILPSSRISTVRCIPCIHFSSDIRVNTIRQYVSCNRLSSPTIEYMSNASCLPLPLKRIVGCCKSAQFFRQHIGQHRGEQLNALPIYALPGYDDSTHKSSSSFDVA